MRLDSASEVPGIEQHVDGERAFVERRQEGAREERHARRGDHHSAQRAAPSSGLRVIERPVQQPRVPALELFHQRAVAVRASASSVGSR